MKKKKFLGGGVALGGGVRGGGLGGELEAVSSRKKLLGGKVLLG